jgi:hypothetical protein
MLCKRRDSARGAQARNLPSVFDGHRQATEGVNVATGGKHYVSFSRRLTGTLGVEINHHIKWWIEVRDSGEMQIQQLCRGNLARFEELDELRRGAQLHRE